MATPLEQALEAKDWPTAAHLYAQGGDLDAKKGAIESACFLWTHAYVHALQAGDQQLITKLEAKLKHYGRL